MGQLPLFLPESRWEPPTDFPSLAAAKVICVDLETRDPALLSHGAGWATGNGEVIGVAIGTEDLPARYYPIGHLEGPNLEREKVLAWLREQLSREHQPKLFANCLYDVGWLRRSGVPVAGRWYDVQAAAPLVDENRDTYRLDALGADYVGEKKDEKALREAGVAFGMDDRTIKAGMWRLPAMYVGEYAEADVELTKKVWAKLEPILREQDLWNLFLLETDLMPCWLEMRWRGIRVNALAAERAGKRMEEKQRELQKELNRLAGGHVEVWAGESVRQAFDRAGIEYPRTERGVASFRKGWLEHHPSRLAELIVAVRQYSKARGTFVDNAIFAHMVNDRIYPETNPLQRTEEDGSGRSRGTVSGRISMSKPNAQQIPKRGEVGSELRSIFVPERGALWASSDFSQQEPRLTAHFAGRLAEQNGGFKGALELIEQYQLNPSLSVYDHLVKVVGMPKPKAKIVWLGRMYGMGVKKLAGNLGTTEEEAKEFAAQLDAGVPFVKDLMEAVQAAIHKRGYIRTLLGRRRRFDKWEPARKQDIWEKPLPREEALKKWGHPLRRAFAYKGLNALIQGSAADQTKKAVLDAWRAGIVPTLQVHDELCSNVERPEDARILGQIMCDAVKLIVPSVVETKVGASWGELEKLGDDDGKADQTAA